MADHVIVQCQQLLEQTIQKQDYKTQYFDNQTQNKQIQLQLDHRTIAQNINILNYSVLQHDSLPLNDSQERQNQEINQTFINEDNLKYLLRKHQIELSNEEDINYVQLQNNNECHLYYLKDNIQNEDLSFEDIDEYKRILPNIHKQMRNEARVQQFRKKRKIMCFYDNGQNKEEKYQQYNNVNTENLQQVKQQKQKIYTNKSLQIKDPSQGYEIDQTFLKIVQNSEQNTQPKAKQNYQKQACQLQLNSQSFYYQKFLLIDYRFSLEIKRFVNLQYSIEDLDNLVHSVLSKDMIEVHYGVIGIRKILSDPQIPYIQAVIDTGIVGKFLSFIQQDQYPQLKLEAAWCLTNIAYGNTYQIQSVLNKGAMNLFINLLHSQYIGIIEQGIWVLGNLASDNTLYRDKIIKLNGLNQLVKLLYKLRTNQNYRKLYTLSIWALSSLCRGTPLPKYQFIKTAIPQVCLAINSNILNQQQTTDCCWVLCNHLQSKQKITVLIKYQIYKNVIKYLQTSNNLSLLIVSVRIIGNISRGNQMQTDALIDNNVLDYLYPLLFHESKLLKKQCCWVISNIAAGQRHQISELLSYQQMIYHLLEMMDNQIIEIRREIAYIFSNICSKGQSGMILNLYQQSNIIQKYLILAKDTQDQDSIQIALKNLYQILLFCEINLGKKNHLYMKITQSYYIDYLQRLQYHKSEKVYKIVSQFVNRFFEAVDPLADYC